MVKAGHCTMGTAKQRNVRVGSGKKNNGFRNSKSTRPYKGPLCEKRGGGALWSPSHLIKVATGKIGLRISPKCSNLGIHDGPYIRFHTQKMFHGQLMKT